MRLRRLGLFGLTAIIGLAGGLLTPSASLASSPEQGTPVSSTVTLRIITTNTDGVAVHVDGKNRGLTPLNLKLKQSNQAVTVSFKKKGFYPKEMRVTPHRARTIKVKLNKVPPPPKKKDPRENLPF